jgi:hypothetical protein
MGQPMTQARRMVAVSFMAQNLSAVSFARILRPFYHSRQRHGEKERA